MLKNDVMMTSLMINLDSEAQFFTEIEEYTGDTVIDTGEHVSVQKAGK